MDGNAGNARCATLYVGLCMWLCVWHYVCDWEYATPNRTSDWAAMLGMRGAKKTAKNKKKGRGRGGVGGGRGAVLSPAHISTGDAVGEEVNPQIEHDDEISKGIPLPLPSRSRTVSLEDSHYGVATMSRLLKTIGLFCRI